MAQVFLHTVMYCLHAGGRRGRAGGRRISGGRALVVRSLSAATATALQQLRQLRRRRAQMSNIWPSYQSRRRRPSGLSEPRRPVPSRPLIVEPRRPCTLPRRRVRSTPAQKRVQSTKNVQPVVYCQVAVTNEFKTCRTCYSQVKFTHQLNKPKSTRS